MLPVPRNEMRWKRREGITPLRLSYLVPKLYLGTSKFWSVPFGGFFG